jgi:hypothetical protein
MTTTNREQAELIARDFRDYEARRIPRRSRAPEFRAAPEAWGVWCTTSDHWVEL